MTNIAVLTKAAVVHIVTAMTAVTFSRQRLGGRHRLRMTIVATGQSVHASQCESGCSLVFEKPVLPRSRVVAVVAAFSEAKLMRVIINVTGNTLRAGVMKCRGLMATYAFQFRVLSNQWEAGKIVIEPGLRSPAVRDVAAFTTGTKLTPVRIVILMARAAILRYRVGQFAAVTRAAGKIFMTLRQCKSGFGVMVELFRTPSSNGVAARAI